MTQHVVLDARADRSLILQTYSRTTDWLWLGTGTPSRLDDSVTDDELAAAINAALDRSQTEIERPEKLDKLMEPVLRVAGVRSQRAYYEGTRSIGITQEDDGSIEVAPSRRRNREFITILDEVISLQDPDPSALVAAIRRAIAISE
jgi:hypothetical protein